MPKDQSNRIRPVVLREDEAVLNVVREFADYKPSNDDHSVASVDANHQAMHDAEEAYNQAEAALTRATNMLIEAQWTFHNSVLGMKKQVDAQYGPNSTQAEEIGRVREDERADPKASLPDTKRDEPGATT